MNNKRDLQRALALAQRLNKKGMPIVLIVIMVVASLIVGNFNGLQAFLGGNSLDSCQIVSIYDGDTMTLQCPGEEKKTKVRLYCIDTPEMQQKPWGKKSRDHLRQLADSGSVKVVQVDTDRYGRVVGEVYRADTNLNLSQVEQGMAAVYDRYCKKSDYDKAEQQAQAAKKGIWAEEGLHQRPWDWRKQNR